MGGDTTDIVLFFGRFHPLVLHIPIGFLTLAFILEVLSRSNRFRHYQPAVGFVLFTGAITAIVAAGLGYMLSQSGDYDGDLLVIHQWSGIGAALIALVAFLLHNSLKRKPSVRLDRAYIITMGVMVLVLAMAGHYGGSLTHGSDYLTKYMPDPLRRVVGMPPKQKKEIKKITNLNEAIVYSDIVYPILDNYCTSCHNESKRKGDLMMHTPEALMKGGENGAVFVEGDAANSDMIKRMQLPENHEDHMPPDGKRQPSEDELELLIWWLNQGASFEKKVAEVVVDDDVLTILNDLVDPQASKSEVEILLSSPVAPADEQTLSLLRSKGVKISSLSNDIHWLQADVAPHQPVDSILGAFQSVSDRITWLTLNGTSTTDQALSAFSAFKNLTRLHLGKTAITDEGLAYLKNLPYLEILNLYETNITDEGIQQLAGLKNLKQLYVWQTGVTRNGADKLQKEIPGLEVNLGAVADPIEHGSKPDSVLAKS